MTPECAWESTNPFSPNGPEGCDEDAAPGWDRCPRHATPEQKEQAA